MKKHLIAVALAAITTIAIALAPYLPFTSPRVLEAAGREPGPISWEIQEVAAGTKLGELGPLFTKMEPLEEGE